MKGGIEACYSSVSCVCALLRALEELSKGKGIQPEQVKTNLTAMGDNIDKWHITEGTIPIVLSSYWMEELTFVF